MDLVDIGGEDISGVRKDVIEESIEITLRMT
jgi:hypothetical protein